MTTRRPTRTGTATPSGLTGPQPLVPMPAGAPDPVRAVSLGLALLKAARVESWADLADTLRTDPQSAARLDGIDLTRDDLALLDAHLGPLGLIRVMPGTRGSGNILTVAVCDRCGRWMLSAGAVPRRCRLTLDCPGAMVKAVPAKPVTRGCLPIAPGQPQGLGGASPGQLGVVATPAATEQARGSEAKSIGESTVAQSGGLRVPIDIDR